MERFECETFTKTHITFADRNVKVVNHVWDEDYLAHNHIYAFDRANIYRFVFSAETNTIEIKKWDAEVFNFERLWVSESICVSSLTFQEAIVDLFLIIDTCGGIGLFNGLTCIDISHILFNLLHNGATAGQTKHSR